MRRLVCTGVMIVVCAVAAVSAQSTVGGSVRGVVKDEQGAVLPGVRITATSVSAPETYTAVSDGEGYYRLTDLPPGDYKVSAALEGFATLVREPIVVRAGMNVGLDLALQVGVLSDTVEVVGDTPLLERVLPSQAVNIDGELQRSLPLSPRRHWTDFLLLTPGVAWGNLGNQRMIYFVHGASFDSQVTLLDGAEVNPARQEYSGGVNLSTEALADVQVTTLGVSASTPLGAGAVVNAVTKSGTNRFSGSAMLTWQDMSWNSENLPGGTSTRSSVFQPEIGAGGPLKRDRVWLFGSYRRNDYREGIDRTPAQIEALEALAPGFELFDRANVSNFAFAKVTALVARDHRVQAFYKYDRDPIDSASPQYSAVFARSVSGGHAASVQWNGLFGQHVTMRATGSFNTASTSTDINRTDVTGRTVYTNTVLSGGRLRGAGTIAVTDNVTNFADRDDRRTVTSLDVTFFDVPGLRSHEVQVGAYWQGLELNTSTSYVNGGFALEELVLRDPVDPGRGAIPFHRQVYDGDRAVTQDSSARDVAFYVQDLWRIGEAATVSAGVRVDRIRHDDRQFGIGTQRSTDVGPRLGINLRVPGDEHATMHASWARRHEAASATVSTVGTNALGFRDSYDLDLDGRFETELVTPAFTLLAPDRRFDPERHQPFVDDFTAGYRRQFGGTTSVDATYVHRAFRDRVAGVEVNAIYANGAFVGYRDPALNDVYLITNNRWNHQVYDGLELRLAHTTPAVQFIGSYTRQWRHLAGTWQPNDPASFIQPEAFANDKGIGYSRGFAVAFDANSLSGAAMTQYLGPTSQWRDHVVNLGCNVRAPWSLIFGAGYTVATGPWSGPVVTQIPRPDPAFGPSVVVLPNGRAVSNPLATTIRFAGANRGEGQFTLPTSHALNLRVGRAFELPGAKVELSVNLLNILNNDADLVLVPGGNQLFSATYRTFTNRQPPRSGQVFARVLF